MATSFKLQALTGVRLTDSIRSKSYYVYIHKLWEFAVPSVCPFGQTSFLACTTFGASSMSIIMPLYTTTHNLSILMDFTCNAIPNAPFSGDYGAAKISKVVPLNLFSGRPNADFLHESPFEYRSFTFKKVSVSQTPSIWLNKCMIIGTVGGYSISTRYSTLLKYIYTTLLAFSFFNNGANHLLNNQ